MDDEYARSLVMARLSAMPPNVSFSIGSLGTFGRDDLISQVKRGTAVGQAAIKMQIQFLKASVKLSERLAK